MMYKGGYKYILEEREIFKVPWLRGYNLNLDYVCVYNGLVIAKAGYAWDGASGPAIDTKTNMRGSLIHDILYQLMREGLIPYELRKKADYLLRDTCREDGMNWIRAWYFRIGCSYFAMRAATKAASRPILEAP